MNSSSLFERYPAFMGQLIFMVSFAVIDNLFLLPLLYQWILSRGSPTSIWEYYVRIISIPFAGVVELFSLDILSMTSLPSILFIYAICLSISTGLNHYARFPQFSKLFTALIIGLISLPIWGMFGLYLILQLARGL